MELESRVMKNLSYIGEQTVKWYEKFVLPKAGYDPDFKELVESSWDYFDRGGKRLRPSLLVLTCKALGGNIDTALPAAAAIESAHNDFLIHDDFEDGSLTRRGKPTLHLIYGNDVAINAGDYLGFKILRCLIVGRDGWDGHPGWGHEKYSLITDLLVDMLEKTGEGQGLELWLRKQPMKEVSKDRVCKILELKTGQYTGGKPMGMGAALADRKDKIDEMERIGIDIAIGFQTIDDILNVEMSEEEASKVPTTKGGGYGKDFVGDADEGKRTLLVAHLLEHASEKDRKKFEKMWGRKKPPWYRRILGIKEGLSIGDKKYLQKLFYKYGSVDYCRDFAENKLKSVDSRIVEAIGPSEGREELRDLLHYFVERTF